MVSVLDFGTSEPGSLKFCESDFYFLNRSKNYIVATYNFGTEFPSLYRVCEYEYGRYSDFVSNIRGLFRQRTI